MNGILNLQSANMIYKQFNTKKKERFDIILEPLQAILQLSLLSFCPNGTKLHIENNLLKIQLPNYSQGLLRWYLKDSKDDLFYLFYVCKRFPKYYKHLKKIMVSDEVHREKNKDKDNNYETSPNLYELLVLLSVKGLDRLISTYSNVDKISLLHTLELYKLLLTIDTPDEDNGLNTTNTNTNNVIISHREKEQGREKDRDREKDRVRDRANDRDRDTPSTSSSTSASASSKRTLSLVTNTQLMTTININMNQDSIDSIFIKINELYAEHEYNVIYNTLMLLLNGNYTEDQVIKYINGLNMLLETTTSKINPWIHNHIVF
jgi:hypothetical protein